MKKELPTIDIDKIELLPYILLLLRKKKLIFFISIFAFSISIVIALVIPPKFKSEAKWLPYQREESQVSGLAMLAGLSLSDNSSERFYEEILFSESFLKRLYNREWLINSNGDKKRIEEIIEYKTDLNPNSELYQLRKNKAILEYLMGIISFNKSSTVLSLSVLTKNAYLSQHMCSLILNDLKGYNESSRFKKAQRKKAFLEKNLVAFKDSLRKAEQSLVYFYKSNKDFASPLLKLKEQRRRRGVDHQFQLVSEFLRQLEMAKVEVEKESEPLVIIQKPSFPIEKASPKRKVIALMGLLGGVGFAICFVLVQSWYRDNKDDFIRDK